MVQAFVGSEEWKQRISESKFSDVEGFGENALGKIMLTDHNSEIWFRNVFIRELSAAPRSPVVCQPVKRPLRFRRFFRCFR